MSENSEDGWVEHDGKGMPVDSESLVVVKHGDGWVSNKPFPAGLWNWRGTSGHDGKYDIVAYRVVKL